MADHPVDGHVFQRNHCEALDETAAFLVRTTRASVRQPFLHPHHHQAACPTCRRAVEGSRQLAWGTLQVWLIRMQNWGHGVRSPVERLATLRSPTALPTASSVAGNGGASTSQAIVTDHLPIEQRRRGHAGRPAAHEGFPARYGDLGCRCAPGSPPPLAVVSPGALHGGRGATLAGHLGVPVATALSHAEETHPRRPSVGAIVLRRDCRAGFV